MAIIILTLGMGLTILLPLADEYSSARRNREQLETLVARMRHDVASLGGIQREVEEARANLRELEALVVRSEHLDDFRQEVIDLARKSGCQVRQLRPETPQSRAWETGGSLFERVPKKSRKKSGPSYKLVTQPLSMVVTGPFPSIKSLLTQLHATERLIEGKDFSLFPSRDRETDVVLDMTLNLYDLTQVSNPSR